MSLYNRPGGHASRRVHVPSEQEGLAITVASALYWAKLRDSSHPDFFKVIGEEVQRAGGSERIWIREELVWFFHSKVMCSIGQEGLQRYLQRKFKLGAV